jgi:uncharacterized repeat protein (TIGR01451 family)
VLALHEGNNAMNARHRFVALVLGIGFCSLTLALTSPLWAEQKPTPAKTAQFQTPEPPLAQPGRPGVRDVPLPTTPPGVRDVPNPTIPPGVRIVPAPADGYGSPETQPAGATYCPVDPPAPVVSIKVRVAACAAPGEYLEYKIRVENHSHAAAHHVTVRNPLPANAALVRADPPPSASDPVLEWRLGTLEGCACRDICLVLKPMGTGDIKNCARVQFEHGECVVTRVGGQPAPVPVAVPAGEPKLTLQKFGPKQAILHQSLDYKLTVTNTGTDVARDVRLTDTMDEGMRHIATNQGQLTWNSFELQPGQSRSFDYQVTTTKPGKLMNRAVVTAGTLRQEATSELEVIEPKLRIEKTGPREQFFRRPATYQITVTNEGSTPLTNVVVTDTLPEKAKLDRMSVGGQAIGQNQVQWLLGTLQPGARKAVQIVLRAEDKGRLVNKATAQADGVPAVTAEAITEFESAAGLTFYIEPPENPATVGMPARYTITIVNQGSAAANDIDITATIPEQMQIKEVRPKEATAKGPEVLFPRIPTLEGGQQRSFEIDVEPIRAGGEATMRVKMTTKELPTGVTKETRTNIEGNGEPPQAR